MFVFLKSQIPVAALILTACWQCPQQVGPGFGIVWDGFSRKQFKKLRNVSISSVLYTPPLKIWSCNDTVKPISILGKL